MGKLSNVKTVDMVNGEITKVEYNGEVYVKVEDNAQAGDLVSVVKPWGWITAGENYLVTNAYSRNGHDYVRVAPSICGYQEDFVAFRKQSAVTPTLDERVSSLESRVDTLENGVEVPATYRLVTDRKPKAGDFVKFTRNFTDVVKGKFYGLYRDGDGDLTFIDDTGDERWSLLEGNQYAEFYEKVVPTETITHNGSDYTLVDREAQACDVVVFTENTSVCFDNNKPYGPAKIRDDGELRVADKDGHYCSVYVSSFKRTPANVKVYAPVSAKEQSLKVGDFAKVTTNLMEFEVGNIVKIDGDRTNSDARVFDFKVEFVNVTGKSKYVDQTHGYIDAKNIAKATDEEVAEAKSEEHKASFKVGDYARVTTDNYEHKVGHVVRINDNWPLVEGSFDFGVDKITNSGTGYIAAKHIEKLSAEEAEKLASEQAELTRWAAIGRKPNEFKKGDVVRVTGGYQEIKRGDIGEITHDDGSDLPGVTVRGVQRYVAVELITPVEARFDRA